MQAKAWIGSLILGLLGCQVLSAGIPEGTLPLYIEHGRSYPIVAQADRLYRLQGRDTPFTTEWYNIGQAIEGTGDIRYGFEPGGPVFLPSRRWEVMPGTDGYSLRFDGVDDFAFHTHDSVLNFTNAMTLEAWVKPESVAGGILLAKALSPAVVCYSLGLTSLNRPLFSAYNSSGTAFLTLTGTTALATGEWTHVSASWDGAQTRLVVNGELDASGAATGSTRVSSSASFQIGSIFGVDAFGGLLDQVRVWGRGRSEAEILIDHASILLGTESGLVGLWRLASNEGLAALDSTANALHMQLGADPSADSGDPDWTQESFVALEEYTEILNFGEPCLVVSHPSSPGDIHRLERMVSEAGYPWRAVEPPYFAKLNRTYHLVLPAEHAAANFRVYGPPAPQDLSAGLVAAFPFDGNPNDTTGNGHDGIARGTVTYITTENGQGLNLNGSSWIKLPDSVFLDGTSNATFAFWFNAQASSGLRQAFGTGDSRAGFDPVSIQFNPGTKSFSDCTIEDTVAGTEVMGPAGASNANLFVTNRWYFFAVSLENTVSGATLRTYLDGDLKFTTQNTNTNVAIRYDRPMPTCIGCIQDNGFAAWRGYLDDVRIYNRCLQQHEIQAIQALGH